MPSCRRSLAALLTGLSASVVLPSTTLAQTKDARFTVGVDGAYRASASDISSTFAVTTNQEAGSESWTLPVKARVMVDVSARVRVGRSLGVSAGYSALSNDGTAAVTARVPHPFFFNQPRTISGEAALQHRERVVHLRVVLSSAANKKLQVSASAGPAFFSATQGLVDNVTYSETYPYDTAKFTGTVTRLVSTSAVGIGGGVDVAYYVSKNIGLGAIASFATATLTAKAADDSDVKVTLGGSSVGVGLRLRF